MFYRLYKLRFATPVRFGADNRGGGLAQASPAAHADTLFSALCSEAAAYDTACLNQLLLAAQADELTLTDLLPYHDQTLYLPRPCLPPAFQQQIGEVSLEDIRRGSSRRKQLKQQKYIPVRLLPDYFSWLQQGGDFPFQPARFGEIATTLKVNRREAESLPYHVAQYCFAADCGLYFVAAAAAKSLLSLLDHLLNSLGYSGIGGKRSAGYGKFELAEDPIDMDAQGVYADDAALYSLLTTDNADWYMALSVLWPAPAELPLLREAYYMLIQRSGFVNNPAYAPQAVKRHSVFMLDAGACCKHKITGQIGDLSAGGAHPIYRYGKPLYAGVKQ